MKRTSILLALLLHIVSFTNAQEKYDHNWVKGYKEGFSIFDFHAMKISIDSSGFKIDSAKIPVYLFEPNVTMSDGNGNLLFSSNNCVILNNNYEVMENGDSIWFPSQKTVNSFCSGGAEYNAIHHGTIALPQPNHDSIYFMISVHLDTLTSFNRNFNSVLYSVIDMRANGGLGRVTKKHQVIHQDTLRDQIAAVRHGNGRDWWLFTTKVNSDISFRYRLSPIGLTGPDRVKMPLKWAGLPNEFYRVNSYFSPDGTMFCRADNANHAQLFRFDRCAGEFSCPVKISLPCEKPLVMGVSFSPDSKLLYVSTDKCLFQFDLLAKSIEESGVFIDTFDGHKEPASTKFYQHHPAPDGKTYLTAPNSMAYLHVINEPNKRGTACNFVQRGQKLPIYNSFSLPFYPNFKLYDWPDSPCDSLGINDPRRQTQKWVDPNTVVLMPNPANEQVEVLFPMGCVAKSMIAYSVTGIVIAEIDGLEKGYRHVFDVSKWPTGVHFLVFSMTDGQKVVKKLSVVH